MSAAAAAQRAPSLDHVGFVGAALEPLIATMQRLGFATTEPQLLRRTDPATSATVSLQQRSCHAVFAAGYVELSAVLSDDPTHHLAAYRARGEGLHILALGSADPDADWQRCTAAGLPCSAPAGASRRIEYGTRHGEARFRWFMLAPQVSPEGLLCVVRNETPELVFQPAVSRHANGTEELCEIVIQTATPSASAARLAIAIGTAPRPIAGDGTAGLRFDLAGGSALTLLPPQSLRARFGAAAIAGLVPERFAALQLRVRSLTDTAAWLAARGVAFERRGPELIVPATLACGAVLAFRQ